MPRRILWVLILAGGALALAGILMRRSPNPAVYNKAGLVGWGGIAMALVARILLGMGQRARNQPKKSP